MYCRKCGHDLHGGVGDCCPECGTEFDRHYTGSFVSEPVSGRPLLWRSLIVLGCAVYVVVMFELIEQDMLPTWLNTVASLVGAACMVTGATLTIGVLTNSSRALRGPLPLHVHRRCTWAAMAIAAGSVLLVVGYLRWL